MWYNGLRLLPLVSVYYVGGVQRQIGKTNKNPLIFVKFGNGIGFECVNVIKFSVKNFMNHQVLDLEEKLQFTIETKEL